MKIGVFGLGYVGSVTAACLARNGHFVIGTDIKSEKVDAINTGKSPVLEKNLDTFVYEAMNSGKLSASTSVTEIVEKAECYLICVGTPSNLDGSIDLQHIKRACMDIGKALKDKKEFSIVVLRSTVLPGTAQSIVKIIENESGKKVTKDFGVCVNPEFMREGQAIYDFYNPERIVIGETDKNSGDIVEKIYTNVNAPVIRVDLKTAEMIKYTDNVFHGLKVAFSNEIGTLCKRMGIDGREIMKTFCMDKKLNLSPYYFKPGFAFGGSCLPKDLRAIIHRSKELGIENPLIESILESNQKHIDRAVELIISQNKKRIGIFGLTFKKGTDDTRESPAIPLITRLLEKGYLRLFDKGYDIGIYDENVEMPVLRQILPHIAPMMSQSFESLVNSSEILVITKNENVFKKIPVMMNENQILFDLIGIFNPEEFEKGKYMGICW